MGSAIPLAAAATGCALGTRRQISADGGERAESKGLILAPSGLKSPEGNYSLFVWDLDRSTSIEVVHPLEVHSVVGNPANRSRILTIGQPSTWEAYELDIVEKQITNRIDLPKERRWGGHGVYSPDGKLLYMTEILAKRNFEGVLTVRDGATLRVVGELPTHGATPHEMALIQGGRILVVANEGIWKGTHFHSNLSFIETSSGKLVDQIPIDRENIFASHLAALDDGTVVVSARCRLADDPGTHYSPAAPRKELGEGMWLLDAPPSPVYVRAPEKPIVALEPAEMRPHMLFNFSTAIHPGGKVFGVVHCKSRYLSFWELPSGTLLKSYDLHPNQPLGLSLSLDGAFFIVSTSSGKLRFFRSDTLEEPPDSALSVPHLGNGLHIATWSLRNRV